MAKHKDGNMSSPMLVIVTCGSLIAAIWGMLWYAENTQMQKIDERRDAKAVSREQAEGLRESCGFKSWVGYQDDDGDGDYDSVLHRPNTNGKSVEIPVQRSIDGLVFPTLAEGAVSPLAIPNGMYVDYLANPEGGLESVAYKGSSAFTMRATENGISLTLRQ